MTLTSDQASGAGAPLTQEETIASLGHYGYGWSDPDAAGAAAQRGLSEAVVRDISAKKNEPEWMLDIRLKALRTFDKKPMPVWGSRSTSPGSTCPACGWLMPPRTAWSASSA